MIRFYSWREHSAPDIELGHGHALWFLGWHPDRTLNPHRAHLADVERWGATIEHPRPDGTGMCQSGITFAQPPEYALVVGRTPTWDVTTWEPLTLTPSILCGACGDHGWIRDGQWVAA